MSKIILSKIKSQFGLSIFLLRLSFSLYLSFTHLIFLSRSSSLSLLCLWFFSLHLYPSFFSFIPCRSPFLFVSSYALLFHTQFKARLFFFFSLIYPNNFCCLCSSPCFSLLMSLSFYLFVISMYVMPVMVLSVTSSELIPSVSRPKLLVRDHKIVTSLSRLDNFHACHRAIQLFIFFIIFFFCTALNLSVNEIDTRR